jgi:hypothetical protein
MKQALDPTRSLRPRGWLGSLRLASVLMLIACGSTEPIEKNLLFEGTITDAATGTPIAGAGVLLIRGNGLSLLPGPTVQSTTSDTQGHYTLSHMGCVHEPWLAAAAAGYYYDDQRVGCQPGSQTVNFSLTRAPQYP